MFALPSKHAGKEQKSDRLIQELGRVEGRLQDWIGSSEKNARLFREDPITALRAAGLDMEDELICELERIMQGIAKKLK